MSFTVSAFHTYLSSLPLAERPSIRSAERRYLAGQRDTLTNGPEVAAIRDAMEGWQALAAGPVRRPLTVTPNPEHHGYDEV